MWVSLRYWKFEFFRGPCKREFTGWHAKMKTCKEDELCMTEVSGKSTYHKINTYPYLEPKIMLHEAS